MYSINLLFFVGYGRSDDKVSFFIRAIKSKSIFIFSQNKMCILLRFQNIKNADPIRGSLFHPLPFVCDIDCVVTVRCRHLG